MEVFKCLFLCVCDARGNKTSLLLCLRILGCKSLAFTVQTSWLTHLLMKKLKPEEKGFYHNNRPSEWKRKPAICMGEAEVLCTTQHCFFKGIGGLTACCGGGCQMKEGFQYPGKCTNTYMHHRGTGGWIRASVFSKWPLPESISKSFFLWNIWIDPIIGVLNVR